MDGGRFAISGLRPGRYYALALPEVDDVGWMAPEFLESVTSQATTFTLAAREQKLMNLRGRTR